MRFSIASLMFLISSFIFGVFWAVISYLHDQINTALSGFTTANSQNIIDMIQTGFGIICALFFIVGILLIFVLDSMADEPEFYWRYR